MVGQSTATKPSRSDDVLDAEEQIRISNQIRAQFDALAPKRPIKPNRSEPDAFSQQQNPVDSTVSLHNIPELDKFQSLRSRSHVPNPSLSLSQLYIFAFFLKKNKKIEKNYLIAVKFSGYTFLGWVRGCTG